jgi:hypothetical protein
MFFMTVPSTFKIGDTVDCKIISNRGVIRQLGSFRLCRRGAPRRTRRKASGGVHGSESRLEVASPASRLSRSALPAQSTNGDG